MLKTVRDFERIARALQDPDAVPPQYRVKTFGFCKRCDKLSECEIHADMESHIERCVTCNAYWNSETGFSMGPIFLLGDMIPEAFREEADRLHSREIQAEFFLDALSAHTQALKAERDKKQDDIDSLSFDIRALNSLEPGIVELLTRRNLLRQNNKNG